MLHNLKVFVIYHSGHYPIPSGSVVIANNEEHALELLRTTEGLAHPLTVIEVVLVDTTKPNVLVVSDGMY